MARLQSPTEEDNRITFGCINVDRQLFETIIKPLFAKSGGVVYVMPEKRALNTVFAGMTAEVPKPRQTFAQAFAPFRLQAPAVPTSNAAASAPAPVGPKRPVSGVASR